MGTITVTAPAKVNLHLEVLGIRPDGFHELAMVMQSIDLADRLSFQTTADAALTLSCDDPSLIFSRKWCTLNQYETNTNNLMFVVERLVKQHSFGYFTWT